MNPDIAAVAPSIDTALSWLPARMDSPAARVLLVAIGMQESRFRHRYQIVAGQPGAKGPARGFWQFERGGGVQGVLSHPASFWWARGVCSVRKVSPESQPVWEALERDDVLAAAFARLLMWTDTRPLPAVGDARGAWEMYLRVWRPGKPHERTWQDCYDAAMLAVVGGDA